MMTTIVDQEVSAWGITPKYKSCQARCVAAVEVYILEGISTKFYQKRALTSTFVAANLDERPL